MPHRNKARSGLGSDEGAIALLGPFDQTQDDHRKTERGIDLLLQILQDLESQIAADLF